MGVPYSEKNCFELVRSFYKDILGVELKHYFESLPEERAIIQNMVYTAKGDFKEVESPRFGDLVLMKIQNLESHVGVFLGEGMILHTLKTTKFSVIDRLQRWKTVVTGYYRPLEME